jgi:CHAD domain-containing protein
MENAFDKEVIHHFRVEFKKLRAFLRMLQEENNHDKLKIPRSLKDVYQKAGQARDLQLHRENIETGEKPQAGPAGHLQLLNKKLATAKKKLKKVMKPELLQEAQQKIGKKLPEYFTETSTVNFVSDKMSGARDIISRKIVSDKDLHTIRKYLKDIIYVAMIFEKDLSLPFPVKNWNPEKEKHFTDLANQLGKFQDCCTSLTQLGEDLRAAAPGAEKKLIHVIHLEQQRLKRSLKQELKEKCADPDHFRL